MSKLGVEILNHNMINYFDIVALIFFSLNLFKEFKNYRQEYKKDREYFNKKDRLFFYTTSLIIVMFIAFMLYRIDYVKLFWVLLVFVQIISIIEPLAFRRGKLTREFFFKVFPNLNIWQQFFYIAYYGILIPSFSFYTLINIPNRLPSEMIVLGIIFIFVILLRSERWRSSRAGNVRNDLRND